MSDPIYILLSLPLFYFINDIIQFFIDIFLIFLDIFFYQPYTIDDYILRVKPLWIKFKTDRNNLGYYEEYVLARDLIHYIELGGDMEYFISGPGSPLSNIIF